jgi:hypothetical protein
VTRGPLRGHEGLGADEGPWPKAKNLIIIMDTIAHKVKVLRLLE